MIRRCLAWLLDALDRATDRRRERRRRAAMRADIERRAAEYRKSEIARNRTRSFLRRGED